MNRARLKTYAPKARLDFLRAVTDRARKIGLTASRREPVTVQGDIAIIAGQPFPRMVAEQRGRLDERIARQGFQAVMEEVAYTWFNRCMAIRYLELHDYLDHGFRVLSHPDGKDRPEILEQAEHVHLPGLDSAQVIALKLDGTKDEALYKLLLLAQCHALHTALPFLFERIDDQTELLLPDNLLATDSVIRKMVQEIAEEDWEQIEVIGWLYQFYISDKKDEVIGKVVKSEDIPAATQLFTPNWIVKYMVQNSLGRQWLATYPHSPLRGKMDYYIKPAEQTEEVQAQLAAITPKELDPERLTLIDPACGSGHILCEAYDLFKELYLERGYRLRDVPRLILEKNLYGLDIDDRAAQMAGFALLMKSRADDRRILDNPPRLNVLALQSSAGLDAQEIAAALLLTETFELVPSGELFPETKRQLALTAETTPVASPQDIRDLLELFTNAKTFGSLLTVPSALACCLPNLRALLDANRDSRDLLRHKAVEDLEPLATQAELLARQYDISVMNPPYMGSKGMNADLKGFASRHFPDSKADLFAMFIERVETLLKEHGTAGLMTPFVWMFLASYGNLRNKLLRKYGVFSLVRPEYHTFFESAYVPICTFVVGKNSPAHVGYYFDLTQFYGAEKQPLELVRAIRDPKPGVTYMMDSESFFKIPGTPIAYWATEGLFRAFSSGKKVEDIATPRHGMSTGNNAKFVRYWYELDTSRICFVAHSREDAKHSKRRWFPYNKGGTYRKWFGNNIFVINYEDDGRDLKRGAADGSNTGFRHDGWQGYFLPSVNWSFISSSFFGVRVSEHGCVFDVAGSSLFPSDKNLAPLAAFLCSKVAVKFIETLNPTLNFQVGNVASLPYDEKLFDNQLPTIARLARNAIELAKDDWNAFETSWDFQRSPLLNGTTVAQAFQEWEAHCTEQRAHMKALEEENNRLFIDAYGLQDELTPDVPDEQITLARADRAQDMRRLVSYAVGCMLGRYSLDEPGLIYAHSGNQGFDASRYVTFPADDDGILPLTEADWFDTEDIANRFAAFLRAAWPPETLPENLRFVADSLDPKAGETPIETVRRYFATQFFRDHLQTYKRRPIYWLFSSGKERAFQALVYLHRYQEGTLSRMRMEYVVPLQSRLAARIDQLKEAIAASATPADRKKREKEREKLLRQQEELRAFDEKLRHYADQRIHLDLDDGVRVNYGKFGDLLAEVKAVTGGGDE